MRSATGPWERARQARGTGGAASSGEVALVTARAALGPAVLGLLLRLLAAAHGLNGALGDPAVLNPFSFHKTLFYLKAFLWELLILWVKG